MRLSARTLAVGGAVALAVGNLGRIPMGSIGGRAAPIMLLDLVMALVWLVLAMGVLSGRVRIVVDDLISATLLFVLVASVSTMLAFGRYGLGAMDGLNVVAYLARWIGYFGWYLFIVWCLTGNEARSAWHYIELAILFIACFGIVQTAFFPGFAQMVQSASAFPNWDEQGRRLVSTILDPNFAGLLIGIALLARLARVAEGLHERADILILLGTGLLLTLSRSSILGLAVGIGVIAMVRGLRTRLVYTFFAGALLLLPFVSVILAFASSFNKLGFDASAAARLLPWIRSVQLIAQHPVLGIGFNAAQYAQNANGWASYTSNQSFDGGLLFVTVMTGLVGLACYLLLLWRVWRSARIVWRDDALAPRDRAHGVATVAVTAAVVVHSLFGDSLLTNYVMQILWVMWGTLTSIRMHSPTGAVTGEKSNAAKRAGVAGVAALPLLLLVAGCQPCAGTDVCRAHPHVALNGAIVFTASGAPEPGVRIDVQLTGNGVNASGSATTDTDGLWEFDQDVLAPDVDTVTATVTVTAPGHAPYTAPPFAVKVNTRRGDATLVGTWFDHPYIHYILVVTIGGKTISGATVGFVRTGGVATTQSSFSAVTDIGGSVRASFDGDQLGNVVGTLTITSPKLARPYVANGFTIPLGFRYGIAAVARVVDPTQSRAPGSDSTP